VGDSEPIDPRVRRAIPQWLDEIMAI